MKKLIGLIEIFLKTKICAFYLDHEFLWSLKEKHDLVDITSLSEEEKDFTHLHHLRMKALEGSFDALKKKGSHIFFFTRNPYGFDSLFETKIQILGRRPDYTTQWHPPNVAEAHMIEQEKNETAYYKRYVLPFGVSLEIIGYHAYHHNPYSDSHHLQSYGVNNGEFRCFSF